MTIFDRVLESEVALALLAVIVPLAVTRAFAWAAEWLRERREDALEGAVRALEVGVHEAWEEFGREWKAAHADGKLTDAEREALRVRAKEVASAVARDEGLELGRVAGERVIRLIIRKIVERRKNGAA